MDKDYWKNLVDQVRGSPPGPLPRDEAIVPGPDPDAMKTQHAVNMVASTLIQVMILHYPKAFKNADDIRRLGSAAMDGAKTILGCIVNDLQPFCDCGDCKIERGEK